MARPALRQLLATRLGIPRSRLGEYATVQYDKVAEYQLRGVVHLHALVRLDGLKTPDGFAAAPPGLDAGTLADLIRQARVRAEVGIGSDPPTDDSPAGAEQDRYAHRGHESWLTAFGGGHSGAGVGV